MATATVDLVLNNSAFMAGMGQAERRAKGFESTVGGLFRRSPFQRAEDTLTQFVSQLGSGNVIGAVSGLAARFSGLGLAATVGVGVALEYLGKFKTQAEQAGDAARNLGNTLALSGGSAGPDQIRQKFDAVLSGTEDLLQKSSG